MTRQRSKQRGAYLVFMSFAMAVLVGIGALVIDLGRLLILNSEMQNAVDAASLAAAKELDGLAGAQARAKAAAREVLEHNSHFGRIKSLLLNNLPDLSGENFEFYCAIGSKFEPETSEVINFCNGLASTEEPEKIFSLSDTDSHFVRVNLVPEVNQGALDSFTVDYFFAPIFALINSDTESGNSGTLSVSALAGQGVFTCQYPPMALCDPFEGTGNHFKNSYTVGGEIELKQQGSNQWANGNFGFLIPVTGKSGATSVSEALADEGVTGCSPAIVTTAPGGMTQKTKAAINTRFGDYGAPAPFNKPDASSNWPPDENVVEYPGDTGTFSGLTDARFGNGSWDLVGYWAAAHGSAIPNGWNNTTNLPTRLEVHDYEVANTLPTDGAPSEGTPTAGRRVLHVAVISCAASGLTGGKSTVPIFNPDGFAKIFLTRKAGGPPSSTIYGEFSGWVDDSDSNYHVEVQLYE